MSLVDSRRLPRALLLGTLVFLLVGGGTGLVLAQTQEPAPAAMAFPRPGASARYTVDEFHVGEARGELFVDDYVLTWMPETWVVDEEYNLRLVHPLRTEFRSGSALQIREAFYDAATGEAVITSGQGRYYTDGGVGCGDGTDCQFRYDNYGGRGGPCAARTDLQQGRPVAKPLQVRGYCDYVDGEETMTYVYRGPQRVGSYETVHFQDPNRSEFEAWFSPEVPFPIQFTSTLSDQIYSGFLGHERMYRIRLADYTPGEGAYTRPVEPAVLAGLGPPSLVPATNLLFDFTGFPAPLSFPDAYLAAATDTGANGLAPFLRQHPDAYVAEAYSQESIDDQGRSDYTWFFVVTDGDGWKSVSVRDGPARTWLNGMQIIAPDSTRQVWVESWTLDEAGRQQRDAGNFYVARDLLPAKLPLPVEALARQAFVENRQVPEARYFGWKFSCATAACLSAQSWIGAGYQVQHLSAPLAAGVAASTRGGDLAILRLDAAGMPLGRWAFTYDRPTYSVGLAGGASPARFELAPQEMRQEVSAWQVPGAAAATSLSFLALLASGAYYFWPSLKGLLGFGLFSRIEDERVLHHPSRRTLHALVEANPGIHFQDLSRRSGFGRGQLDHHLRKLQAANLISRIQGQGYTCFFARGQVDRRIMAAAPALRSDGARAVLLALHKTPGASSRDLALRLGLAPGTVSYHVKRLREVGLLQSLNGNLHLTEDGQQAGSLAGAA